MTVTSLKTPLHACVSNRSKELVDHTVSEHTVELCPRNGDIRLDARGILGYQWEQSGPGRTGPSVVRCVSHRALIHVTTRKRGLEGYAWPRCG